MSGDPIIHTGTAPTRPIRLVTAYDLRRSRLMVFFRILLALPHIVWILLWTLVAILAGLLNWLVTLVAGQSPAGLHEFLARYVRYGVHLNAFLFGGANQFPGFAGAAGSYPIDLHVDPPAPQRRVGVFFRLVLALPALILSSVLSGGGVGVNDIGFYSIGVLAVAGFLGWFASLFTARMPAGLEHAVAYAIGYQAQASGYLLVLTDRYPDSNPALIEAPELVGPHPVRLRVTDDLRRSRLTVAFRLLLALPHIVWLTLWGVAAVLVALIGWFSALFTGRLPASFHGFLSAYLRYSTQVTAYLMLVANPFPGFVPADDRPYPVELEIDDPARQNRWVVFFRIWLVLPAAILGAAYGGALGVVAILGWFASLFTGRMPEQLRNLGAAVQRYSGQYYAYVLLLTDRYPYTGPAS
ncbi:MAG: hypothetical protein QOI98_2364 [Solirubrobacteraceae bacterium]|jgi:hypothetical protein|nr:hypothetical protein [Solirubrobacteraceae bacterium]